MWPCAAGGASGRAPSRPPAWQQRQRAVPAAPVPAARGAGSRTVTDAPQHTYEYNTSRLLGPDVPRAMALGTLGLVAAAFALLALPEPAAALGLDQLLGGVEEAVASAGALGPLLFIAAYVVATVLLVPGSVLTLAAGALFGPLLGTAVVSVASTLGASAAFLVGRYLARPAVERRIASNRKFSAVDAAIAAKGPRIVLLLRLSPLFPFTLLNYALSLTSIEFGPYVLSSWAGMLPGTVAYVALGGAGRAAAETAAGAGLDPLRLGLYVVGAVATLWVTKIISQTATKALQEASEEVAAGAGEEGEGGDARTPLNR